MCVRFFLVCAWCVYMWSENGKETLLKINFHWELGIFGQCTSSECNWGVDYTIPCHLTLPFSPPPHTSTLLWFFTPNSHNSPESTLGAIVKYTGLSGVLWNSSTVECVPRTVMEYGWIMGSPGCPIFLEGGENGFLMSHRKPGLNITSGNQWGVTIIRL